MNRCTSVLLLLALAGACGGGSKQPAPAPVTNTSLPAPSCDDAAATYARVQVEHIAHGEADPDVLRPKIVSQVARVCVDGAWSAEARACYADGAPTDGPCVNQLTPDQVDALHDAIDVLVAEIAAAQPVPDLAALEAKVAAAKLDIPECDLYVRELLQFAKCDQIPPEARVAALQGVEAMIDGWKALDTMPPKDRAATQQAASEGCKAAVDGVKQTRDALGCTTP